MSRYGGLVYHGGTYGESPRLVFSAEPMAITVMGFYETYVDWLSPSGNFSKFRLVRNQNGFPETEEDGTVVYEFASADGSSIEGLIPGNRFRDGEDNPSQTSPIPGRPLYYRIFLFTSDKYWVNAGSVSDIMPANTGVTGKMMDLLPRIYTSKEQSPLGVVDPTSDLYNFLDAFGFTYEQMLTELALIRPQYVVDSALFKPIPIEDANVGLDIDYNLPVVNQRRLIREALYLYSQRGLKRGLEDYAESLTGYAPTATVSPNLLLTVQDSTFYNSTGNWAPTNATLSSSEDIVPLTGSYVIDHTDSCKIVASASGTMTLGLDNPITKGFPVTASTQYTVGFAFRSPTSDGDMTIAVRFYDKDGVATSAATTSSSVAANNTWKTNSVTATSDATSCYAVITIAWSAAGTYYVDEVSAQLGASYAYQEARAITLNLVPKKINYIPNPSFEIDASNWTVTGATFSQDTSVPSDGYSGTHSGKFVAVGSWSIACPTHIPVVPGSYFSFSMYTKSPALTSMGMTIDVYDATGTLIHTFTDTHTIGTMWMRGSLSALITSDMAASYVKVSFSGAAGTLYLDMVQAEASFAPTDYIDGSMPEQFGAIWSGTAHASSTLLYTSKLVKIPKLAYTMQDWVPMNAWWRVTTPAGVEYTNLSAV